MPVTAACDSQGREILINVDLPGRTVYAKVWRIQVGRIPIFLMDTDVPRNAPQDRELSARLYGGDREMRISQEVVLGIGGVRDIWEGVERGVDTFDCVHPTRLARHGGALAVNARERLNLRNAAYASDTGPLDAACGCYTCQTVSRGYLHHLVKSGEPLGYALLALHNIRFMNDLMRVIRQSLLDGTFAATKRAWLARLEAPAEELESMADAGG